MAQPASRRTPSGHQGLNPQTLRLDRYRRVDPREALTTYVTNFRDGTLVRAAIRMRANGRSAIALSRMASSDCPRTVPNCLKSNHSENKINLGDFLDACFRRRF